MTGVAIGPVSRRGRERDATPSDAEAARADRDRMVMIGDALFIEGYELALREVRDHFRATRRPEIAAEVAVIWHGETAR